MLDLAEASIMKCPVCKTEELDFSSLENNLMSRYCDKCGGNWIPSFEYWKWREQHKDGLPETQAEQAVPPNPAPSSALIVKLCPECNKILIQYRVGHGANFSIDKCGNCGGIWFDKNEWEALKARDLHDDVYLIFTAPWQDKVRGQESRRAQEARYRNKFGDEGFNEMQRVKAWIDGHPRKQEILAYLTSS
jgi:Zn-finger nucleic acid-binding protein